MNSSIYAPLMARMTIRTPVPVLKIYLKKVRCKRHFRQIAGLYTDMSQTKSITVDQHYTVAEVAELLNVHEMTVRQWYWKNGLKIQRVGRKGVRIAAADLTTFLLQCNRAA